MKQNPWLGLASYDEQAVAQGYKFYGRERAINELYSIVDNNLLTTLYGKSGIGKSSLLQAGVFPRLRTDNYLPVMIRLGAGIAGNYSYTTIVMDAVRKAVAEAGGRCVAMQEGEAACEEERLWHFFHSTEFQSAGGDTLFPVIVLDQFEELYYRDKQQLSTLLKALYLLVDDSPLSSSDEDEVPNYRIVLSIREDDLFHLEDSIDKLRLVEMKYNRYRLRELTDDEARDVVLLPGAHLFSPSEADAIANRIIQEAKAGSEEISTAVLSLLCSRIYYACPTLTDSSASMGITLQRITEFFRQAEGNFLKSFYDDIIKELKSPAKWYYIEDTLVTDEGRRNSVLKSEFDKMVPNSDFLFRGEKSMLRCITTAGTDEPRVEIIHDMLARQMMNSRNGRKLKKSVNLWRLLLLLLPILVFAGTIYSEISPTNHIKKGLLGWKRIRFGSNQIVDLRELESLSPFKYNNIVSKAVCSSHQSVSHFLHLKELEVKGNEGHKNSPMISDCPLLEKLILSDSITQLSSYFIRNCPNLKSLSLPDGVCSISDKAILSEDLSIRVDTLANKNFVWEHGVLWRQKRKNAPIAYMQELIYKSETFIPFIEQYSDKDSIVFRGKTFFPLNTNHPPVIKLIDTNTLAASPQYRYYEHIDLGGYDDIRVIDDSAFLDCSQLRSIILPPNLDSIGSGAFSGCTNLNSISFPHSLKYIGTSAFESCLGLDSIVFTADSTDLVIDQYAFANCQNVGKVVFPDFMSTIDSYSFENCHSLRSIYLPDSSTVSSNAFANCQNIQEFYIDENNHFFYKEDSCDIIWCNKIPMFCKSNAYHTYNNDKYFSSEGLLYERGLLGGIVSVPINLFNHFHNVATKIFHSKYGRIRLWSNENVIRISPIYSSSVISKHKMDALREVTFYRYPIDLKEIHIVANFPPDISNLPRYIKKNVTLHVPYRCKEFYENHPDYIDFRSIEEDGRLYKVKAFLSEMLGGVQNYFLHYRFLFPLAIIGIFALCLLMYMLRYGTMTSSKYGKNKRKIISLLISLLYTIFLGPITFIGFYWLVFLKITPNAIVASLIGVVACIGAAFVLTLFGKVTVKELWRNRNKIISKTKAIIRDNKKEIIITLKITLGLIVISIIYAAWESYIDKRKVYREAIISKARYADKGKKAAIIHEGFSTFTIKHDSTVNDMLMKNFVPIQALLDWDDYPVTSIRLDTVSNNMYIISRNVVQLRSATTGDLIKVLEGHTDDINGAEFSNDNSRLVTYSDDKTAILWDAPTGKLIKVLEGHSDDINGAKFSNDNSRLVTYSDDNTAILWDAPTGKLIKVLEGHSDDINGAEFSNDNSRLVTYSRSYTDTKPMLWDAATGELIKVLEGHTSYINGAEFSNDNSRLVTYSDDNTAILWNAATGELFKVLEGHTDDINGAEFSNDNSKLVTYSNDKTAILWDAATGESIKVLEGHTSYINGAKFSNDNSRLVTYSKSYTDTKPMLWNAATGELFKVLEGHTSYINGAEFSNDNSRLVTYSDDNTAILWNAATGELFKVLEGHSDDINGAKFSNDNSRLVTYADDKTAILWNAATGELIKSFGAIESTSISQDGKLIVYSYSNNTAKLWDAPTGELIKVLKGHSDDINGAKFSNDNSRLVTYSDDNTAILWDAPTGKLIKVLEGHSDDINGAEFSNDNSRLVTYSRSYTDTKPMLWDAATGESIKVLEGHTSYINGAKFSNDNSRLVTYSRSYTDTKPMLWNAATGELIKVLEGHTSYINGAEFSNDNSRLVTYSDDNTAILWNAATGELFKVLEGHTDDINGAEFSNDNSKLVTYSDDNTAILWNAATGELFKVLEGHTNDMNGAKFSNDNSRLVTYSDDKTAILWDAATGESIKVLEGHTSYINGAKFSNDNSRLVTYSNDNIVRLWDKDSGSHIATCSMNDQTNSIIYIIEDWLITKTDQHLYRIDFSKKAIYKQSKKVASLNPLTKEEKKDLNIKWWLK